MVKNEMLLNQNGEAVENMFRRDISFCYKVA